MVHNSNAVINSSRAKISFECVENDAVVCGSSNPESARTSQTSLQLMKILLSAVGENEILRHRSAALGDDRF